MVIAGLVAWLLYRSIASDRARAERERARWAAIAPPTGDAGLVYFWIREADLRERRFDRVWTIFECH